MYSCSYGISNLILLICFKSSIVLCIGPYSCLFRMCIAYADWGLLWYIMIHGQQNVKCFEHFFAHHQEVLYAQQLVYFCAYYVSWLLAGSAWNSWCAEKCSCSFLVNADGVPSVIVQSRTNELHGSIQRNTFWWRGHLYYGDDLACTVTSLPSFRRGLCGSTRSNIYQGSPLDTELYLPTKLAPWRFLLTRDFRLIRGVNEEHGDVLLRLCWRSFSPT
jgi:hypothetical protein